MSNLTHTITVSVTGRYPHGAGEQSSVTISGHGDIDHHLDTFRAALVAAGFSVATAARLTIADDDGTAPGGA